MNYVYLISNGTYCKIGKSKNPEARFLQLKTANPNCYLLCYGDGIAEEILHVKYKDYRISGGEWFDLSKEMISDVIGLIKSPIKVCLTERICTKCGKIKALSEFIKNKYNRNKVGSHCRKCEYIYYKGYLSKKKQKLKDK